MSRSFIQRAFAASLATLVLWTGVRVPLARAEDPDEGAAEQRVANEEHEAADRLRAVYEQAQQVRPLLPQLSEEAKERLTQGDQGGPEVGSIDRAQLQATTQRDLIPLSLPSGPAKTAVTPQAISLPKGEGSIEGMGESFTPNLSSGTGTYSVPIALPAGRNGVGPSLALSYSTSGGNGPLGIGWSFGVPFIARQTDKGLPRYVDRKTWHIEEDRFVYNGGQELVPIDSAVATAREGAPVPKELSGWQQYRARVEGGFMRFFRAPDSSRWIVQSKDGTRFEFGAAPYADNLQTDGRASDPSDSRRVFAWHLVRMSDVHGSAVNYVYSKEHGQVYLRDIYYDSPGRCGARPSVEERRVCGPLSDFGRRIRFVYEARPDVTASYVSTWRVESTLRLVRIEVTSALGQVGRRWLVRRYRLAYDSHSYHSLLASLQVEGRPSVDDALYQVKVGRKDISESFLASHSEVLGDLLPPMTFGYTQADATTDEVAGFGGIDATVRSSASTPDHSVDEGRSDFFDVNSDGLPDLLVTDPGHNRGAATVYFNGFPNGAPGRAGEFSGAVRVGIPEGMGGVMSLDNLNIVPMDIDGEGRGDLLHMPRAANYGYFLLSKRPSGRTYQPLSGWEFAYVKTALGKGQLDPLIDLGKDGAFIKTFDVDNDHLMDVVKTTGSTVETWLNLGRYPGGDGRFGSVIPAGTSFALSTAPLRSCLPFAGRAVDFSDPETRIADMNGDGIQDIVRLSFSQLGSGDAGSRGVVYWPGRGQGAFGDGPATCTGGVARDRQLRMESSPTELDVQLDKMQLVDVNEDGTTDLVYVGFDRLSVWFNEGGHRFSERLLVEHAPFTTDLPSGVRIADIDGSGTTDIVYAHGARWKWIDPMGGVRPRLLQTIDNGLGALTTLEYSPSAEDYLRDLTAARTCAPTDLDCFTWQREQAQANDPKADCDQKVLSRSGVCVHRAGGSPVISTVVRRIRTTDRMDALGVPAQVTENEYRYHDGYYEGIEQEFRGFGAADVVALGDEADPTSIVRTFFHQGRRPNRVAGDRLADNPNESLKGREFLSETSDEHGAFLSSSHATYAVRRLFEGLNGVDVSYAYVSRSDEFRYDTAPFKQSRDVVPLASIEREEAGHDRSTFKRQPVGISEPPHQVHLRGEGAAQLVHTIDSVDNLGHLIQQTAHGRGEPLDGRIEQHASAVRIDDAECGATGWLWRTEEGFVRGHGDEGRALGLSRYRYTACGDPRYSESEANLPTEGAFSFAGDGKALSLTHTDQLLVASARFDSWGQPKDQCVGADLNAAPISLCLHYGARTYDEEYQAFVQSERFVTEGNGADLIFLETKGGFDEGLGLAESVTDPNGLSSRFVYDGFGRLTATELPNVRECAGKRVPTTRIEYALTQKAASVPLNVVRTTAERSCLAVGADAFTSYSYVDGVGRVRASLTHGDGDGSLWE